MLNLSKNELIENIRKKYITVQNKEYLNRFLRQYETMPDEAFEQLLKSNEIQSIEVIYNKIEDFLLQLSSTRIGKSDGEYLNRIRTDEKLQKIIRDARNIENPTVERVSYFVEHRLCEIISEASAFPNTIGRVEREKHLLRKLTLDYKGNCQVFSKLYVDMLSELGIDAEIVRQQLDASNLSHFDVVVFGENNRFLVNVIGDIYRVQTNRLSRVGEPKYEEYAERIEDVYGPLSKFSNKEIKEMDESFGFIRERDEDGNAVYFDEKLKKYLEDVKLNLPHERKLNANELETIILEYFKFISDEERFTGNNKFMEKHAHYFSCMSRFIRTLDIEKDDDKNIFKRKTFRINGDLDNLLEVWFLKNQESGKTYYFTFDDGPIELADGKKIYSRVANGELDIAKKDMRIPEEFRRVEEQSVIGDLFGDYILTPDKVAKQTGKEQRDSRFKNFVQDTMDKMVERFGDFIK